MRQVPEPQNPTYLIVGNGKVSRHLQFYFSSRNIPFIVWTRSSDVDFSGCANSAHTILVLIKDDQIVPFINGNLKGLESKTWIHFSGLLSTPLAESAHPLMTFGDELYDPEFYSQVPFVTEEGRKPFDSLFPGLPNPSYEIPPGHKPIYHAFCVMAGNFTTILWENFFDQMRRLGIPAEATHPYLKKISENLTSGGRPLTGPFERNDVGSILKHLEALHNHPMKNIYEAFFELYKTTIKK
ncbi:MAG TPA: DUF2520 domain-containing protein [Bacteroidales bacterium]|nr:DUF2520 domain-containing protein [Bacteroidales bacterium]